MKNRLWLLVVCLVVALSIDAAPRLRPVRTDAQPIDSPGTFVTLPYANMHAAPSNWETVLVLTNVSDTPITVPHFWDDYQVGGPVVVVPGKRVVRIPGWPREGGGIEDLELPDDVTAAVELRNPNGMVFRVGPMDPAVNPGESVEWIGLRAEGEFRSLLLLGVKDEAAAIEIEAFAGGDSLGVLRDFMLTRGCIIFWAPAGTTRIVAKHGAAVGPAPDGPFWGVAWIWHDPLLENVATVPAIHHASD